MEERKRDQKRQEKLPDYFKQSRRFGPAIAAGAFGDLSKRAREMSRPASGRSTPARQAIGLGPMPMIQARPVVQARAQFRRSGPIQRFSYQYDYNNKSKMYRRKRSGFKSSYKKKRYQKSYIPRSIMSSDTNVINVKCIQEQGLVVIGAGTMGAVTIMWGSNDATLNNNYVRIALNNEFIDNTSRYKYWRLKGVKYEFFPITSFQSTAATAYMYISQWASSTDSVIDSATADATIKGSLDYRAAGGGHFSRYMSVGKHFRSKGEDWLACGNGVPTYYSAASSVFKQLSSGFAAASILGTGVVTWYVQYKNPVYT